jgi:hypothetical protein
MYTNSLAKNAWLMSVHGEGRVELRGGRGHARELLDEVDGLLLLLGHAVHELVRRAHLEQRVGRVGW